MFDPNFIDVQGTGAKLDTVTVTQTSGTKEKVHREITVQGDHTDPDALQAIDPIPEAARVVVYDALGNIITDSTANALKTLLRDPTGADLAITAPPGDNSYGVVTRPVLPLTAFGDLRVAELSPVLQISFEYTVTNTEVGTIEVTNSGTVTQAEAMCVVSTGTDTGSTAEWETGHSGKYRAGMGGLFRGTAMFTQGVVGTEQMIGIGDTEGVVASHINGYGVGYDGAIFSLLRWQNDVLLPVAQSAWDDPMDGTGPSRMTLDPTKLNVYFIQFQYLGAGAIKLWIEDDATGSMVLAHTSLYANLNTVPSVFNPNFQMMLHVLNRATTSNMVAKSSSMAYFVEGKTRYTELQQPQFSSDEQTKAGVTDEVAIFTIRNKTLYAGKTNFIDLVLCSIGGSIEASSANNLGKLRLVRNAALGGTPNFTDINATDSIVDIDVAGTTVTGGKTLFPVSMAGKNDRISEGNLVDYDIILSPGETITVAGSSAASATINGSLLWKELF